MLLQVQTAAVEDVTAQLCDSTSLTSRQQAELSAKEAQVKRLDGELSEQQGQVHHLQTLASEKTNEVERLTAQLAEKQGDIEKREGVMRQFATRLRSSQQQVAAEKQEKDSAVHAYSLVAQVYIGLARCLAVVVTCAAVSQQQVVTWHIC